MYNNSIFIVLCSNIQVAMAQYLNFSFFLADNIRYGRPEATVDECTAAAKTANALDFIEALPSGFNTSIGDQQIMLSGGQKQRIAIARAMIRHPQVGFKKNCLKKIVVAGQRPLLPTFLTFISYSIFYCRFWFLMKLLPL